MTFAFKDRPAGEVIDEVELGLSVLSLRARIALENRAEDHSSKGHREAAAQLAASGLALTVLSAMWEQDKYRRSLSTLIANFLDEERS